MKYLKIIFCFLVIAVIFISCDVNENKFPINPKKVINKDNSGGFLRIISSSGSTWNVLKLDEQQYKVTLEEDDAEDGGQLKSVEFFVGYNPNSSGQTDTVQVTTEPFRMFQASDFMEDDSTGLPRLTTKFTSQQLLDALGLQESDIHINGKILLRWTLNLTNGNSLNAQNSGPNITGGAFFNSPFAVNISQSLAVSKNMFTGTYKFTQKSKASGGGIIASGDGFIFGSDATGTVTLKVDPDNKLNGRVFTTDEGGYFDGGGFGTPIDPVHIGFTIDPLTNKNYTFLAARSGTGLACNSGIFLGRTSTVALEGSWTSGDDSQFTLSIVDDVTKDCGSSSNPVTFTFNKQ